MFDDIDIKYRPPSSKIEPKNKREKRVIRNLHKTKNLSPRSKTCYAVAFPPFSISPRHIIYAQILMIAYDSYNDCSNANICQ